MEYAAVISRARFSDAAFAVGAITRSAPLDGTDLTILENPSLRIEYRTSGGLGTTRPVSSNCAANHAPLGRIAVSSPVSSARGTRQVAFRGFVRVWGRSTVGAAVSSGQSSASAKPIWRFRRLEEPTRRRMMAPALWAGHRGTES
jgi:hypothetical protein